MIIMISSDFYGEYELIKATDAEAVREYARKAANGIDADLPADAEIIGSSDDITTDEAIQTADEIIFISDLIA